MYSLDFECVDCDYESDTNDYFVKCCDNVCFDCFQQRRGTSCPIKDGETCYLCHKRRDGLNVDNFVCDCGYVSDTSENFVSCCKQICLECLEEHLGLGERLKEGEQCHVCSGEYDDVIIVEM